VQERHDSDVLVIGRGIAGLFYSLQVAQYGTVSIVTKQRATDSATNWAQGGIAAVLDDQDSFEAHARDTINAGAGLCREEVVHKVVERGPAMIDQLLKLGADFDPASPDSARSDLAFDLGREGGHSHRRILHHRDTTGQEIERTLIARVRAHPNITLFETHCAVDLVTVERAGFAGDNRALGAYVLDATSERVQRFCARVTLLATGGAGKVYLYTSNPDIASGDGMAMAYRAGATLSNMEFIQFHPTGMVWPPSVRGILVTEGVRGEGGALKNSEGRRFMFDDIPPLYANQTADTPEKGWRYVTGDRNARRPAELLPRDHVARCIVREVKEGRGSPPGGVFLDIAWIKEQIPNAAEHIKKKLPAMYHQFKALADIDITEEPMEVGPTTHYAMGGLRVDADTQMSNVPGLFAAGECAAGLHGANRLGGNSLSDLLVFGERAGRHAAGWARDHALGTIDAGRIEAEARLAEEPFGREANEGPYAVQHDLQDVMQQRVGIVRNEDEMTGALESIAGFRLRAGRVAVHGNREYNPGWHTALDLQNLLLVSEMVARSACSRKESRGAHFREDYPAKDENEARVNTVLKRADDGSMQLERRERPVLRDDLAAIIEEMK